MEGSVFLWLSREPTTKLLHSERSPLGSMTKQGSLHSTPEHCLVNGGFQLYFGVEKAMFQTVAKCLF